MGLLSPLTIAVAEHRHADNVLLGTAYRRLYRALTAAELEKDTHVEEEGYLEGLARAKAIVTDVIRGLDQDAVPVENEAKEPTDWHTPRFAEDPRADRLERYVTGDVLANS